MHSLFANLSEAKLPTKWLFISEPLVQFRLRSKICLKRLVITDIGIIYIKR